MQKATIVGKIRSNTFGYMYIGARHLLEKSKENEEGQLYNLIGCILFCAFTLEAYFNHLGEKCDEDWNKKERKLSKLKKYEQFCKQLEITSDYSVRPYSTIRFLFEFRDFIAHGKSTSDSIRKEVTICFEKPDLKSIRAPWMEPVTIENATIAMDDVTTLIKELHLAAGYEDNPFNDLGSSLFGIQRSL